MQPRGGGETTWQEQTRRLSQSVKGLIYSQARTRQRVCALEARERCREAGRTPRFPVEFKSQFGEDSLLWDLFSGRLEGFFVEVGAFDGYHYSVTYALEAVGWKGLLVEANPERAEACRRLRTGSRVVHAALGPPGGADTVEFVVTQDSHGGMLSYVPAGAEHQQRMQSAPRSTVRVPSTTMNELLKDHEGPIDVAVVDVETYEVPLLKGFDLERFRPRVLVIEDNGGEAGKALKDYMSRQPYVECALIILDRVYVHREEAALLARFRELSQ